MMKSKAAGRPRGKRFDAFLGIPIEKAFYNKFKLAAQCEGESISQLARKILRAWVLQQGEDILKAASNPTKAVGHIGKALGSSEEKG